MIDFSITSKPNPDENNTLTTGQYYMTAVDIREKDRKKIFITNTHNSKGGGQFSTNEGFASLKQASIYTPAQT